MDQSHKTINRLSLVVDDDPHVIDVVSALLNSEYNVLTAESGVKALEQSRAFTGQIDLLLSDFQMRGLSGMDLASFMTADRPGLKVLADVRALTVECLLLNEGWHFYGQAIHFVSQLRALISGLLFPDRQNPKFSK